MIQIILRVRNVRTPSCQQPGAEYIFKKILLMESRNPSTPPGMYKTLLQKKKRPPTKAKNWENCSTLVGECDLHWAPILPLSNSYQVPPWGIPRYASKR